VYNGFLFDEEIFNECFERSHGSASENLAESCDRNYGWFGFYFFFDNFFKLI
jgi:hypothetical protein